MSATKSEQGGCATKPELWEGAAERENCREHAFEFDAARTRFGRGVLAEAGETAKALGMRLTNAGKY